VSQVSTNAARDTLIKLVAGNRDRLIDITQRLVRAPSENPPGDTQAVAEAVGGLLKGNGIETEVVTSDAPITNVIARLRGGRPGRRLIYNGHLDTYPIGNPSEWSVDPLGGMVRQDRLYGRGSVDMKGGIACSMLAMLLLAELRDAWAGEVVATFAGDEENMGTRGTQFLLETYRHASGDAMITGDAGSPDVLRFGEKGMIWLEIEAKGRAAHGAHVHLGVNAVEQLMDALGAVFKLRDMPVRLPADVDHAIREASAVSEAISGKGESETLRRVTVNCGLFQGGVLRNIIPPKASATIDIRLPAGVTVADAEKELAKALAGRDRISYRIDRCHESRWSDPNHEVVGHLARAGEEVRGRRPVANYRVGASDSRLYRERNIPSIVCGLTPHNMGAPDEFVDLNELYAVAYMHTLAGFDYLTAAR
jgi:succinyl-diaminopimelate desuccinylase